VNPTNQPTNHLPTLSSRLVSLVLLLFTNCSFLRQQQTANGVPGREQISHNGLNAMLIRLVDDALLLARDDVRDVNMTNSRSAPAPPQLAALQQAVPYCTHSLSVGSQGR
jgi:hypothetical protein